MIWKLFENALASTLSSVMLEARVERLLDRVQHVGAMTEAELQKLRDEVRERLVEVEDEGRELRQVLDRIIRDTVDRFRGGKP